MPRGISLHVGVNRPSPAAFPNLAPLVGPENDAEAMLGIAVRAGFASATLLRGPGATFKNVKEEIERAAAELDEGDIFLFTFAGHGCRIFDLDLDLGEEPDESDENIVLFDFLMPDDYLKRVLWPKFRKGVRIFGIADSCHSGSTLSAAINIESVNVESVVVTEHVALSVPGAEAGAVSVASVRTIETIEVVSREVTTIVTDDIPAPPPVGVPPAEVEPPAEEEVVAILGFGRREISRAAGRAHREADENRDFYGSLNIPAAADAAPILASFLSLAACSDEDTTQDGFPHGEFTTALLRVWNGGAFAGSYVTFRQQIEEAIQERFPIQTPILKPEALPDFSNEKPFTV